jgi:2'-5' RNA ligase
LRLFIAIKFKDDTIDRLQEIKYQLEDQNIDGRFIRSDLFHITLHYIGPSTMREYQALKKMIHSIDYKPFKIKTSHMDYFGKKRNKKLLYLSIENSSFLSELHEEVIDKLKDIGYEIEPYTYVPHITMARNARFNLEDIHLGKTSFSIEVDEVHLMESKRVNDQLVYESKDYIKL